MQLTLSLRVEEKWDKKNKRQKYKEKSEGDKDRENYET